MVFLKGDTPAHHMFAVSANAHANLNHVAYETRGLRRVTCGRPGTWSGPGHEMVGTGSARSGGDTLRVLGGPQRLRRRVHDGAGADPGCHDLAAAPVAAHPGGVRRVGYRLRAQPRPFVGTPDPGLWTPPPV